MGPVPFGESVTLQCQWFPWQMEGLPPPCSCCPRWFILAQLDSWYLSQVWNGAEKATKQKEEVPLSLFHDLSITFAWTGSLASDLILQANFWLGHYFQHLWLSWLVIGIMTHSTHMGMLHALRHASCIGCSQTEDSFLVENWKLHWGI